MAIKSWVNFSDQLLFPFNNFSHSTKYSSKFCRYLKFRNRIIFWSKRKVWTFWEAQIIWKNLPHGFEVYQVNQMICQNHEKDFFKVCVFLRKSDLYPGLHFMLARLRNLLLNTIIIQIQTSSMINNLTNWDRDTSPGFLVTTSHFSGVVTNIWVCMISVLVSCMSPVNSRTLKPRPFNFFLSHRCTIVRLHDEI